MNLGESVAKLMKMFYNLLNANDSQLGVKMRKIKIALLMLLLLVGCSAHDAKEGIHVVVSFGVLEEVVNEVGGDKVQVTNIVGDGDAHSWEPTPKDSVLLNNADLIVIVGAGFEHWFESISNTIDVSKVVDTSSKIDLIRVKGTVDPHIWMDPLNVIKQAKVVVDALMALDGENGDYYLANYERYAKTLLNVDEAYRGSNLRGTIVSSHASFGYLARAYGLEVLSVEGLVPSDEPSIASITKALEAIKAKGVKHIFYDNEDDSKVATMIAKEVGIEALWLSPLEIMERDYVSIMMDNLKILEEALGQ